MSDSTVLEVAGLRLDADTHDGMRSIVSNVDLRVGEGEIVGIVGESGSGKSMTANSIMRLQPPAVRIVNGSIRINDLETIGHSEREMTAIRGRSVGMIFQDPTTYLNPIATVGRQIAEAVPLDNKRERLERVGDLLGLVGLPKEIAHRQTYPHELSGGMKQRALIAMALAGDPSLLIADEPTTALDVTVQAQILDLIKDLRDRLGMGVLMITHDLGVVRYICDRTYVMYQGETIESGTTEAILDSPEHPYTRRLIEAASEMDLAAGSAHSRAPVKAAGRAGEKLLSVQGLQKTYTLPRSSLFGPRREFHALESVDLEIEPGESVAVIGESGSGKSTLGNIVLKTKTPSGGSVSVDGRDIAHLRGPELKRFRSRVQTIFQNPYSSLNPVKTIEHTLTQPFLTHAVCGAREARERARDMLEAVDLPRSYMSKYPHQLSGGERQRVAIARAMALKPKLVIADEPVSALDMSIRGQILNLLDSFRVDDGVSFLLITHDLADAARLTDRVIVLYRGSIVETGPTKEVLHNPQHPYTRTLVAATLPVSAARSEEAGDDDMTP